MSSFIHFHKPEEENGYLSNWDMSGFSLDGKQYCCAEQYLMEQKALLFGDTETAEKIMQSTDPGEMQKLGKSANGFVDEIWDGSKQVILYRALEAKFDQNPELAERLLDTGDAIPVECARKDQIWGIGRRMDDPRADKIKTWDGQNLLGFALMQIRGRLRKQAADDADYEKAEDIEDTEEVPETTEPASENTLMPVLDAADLKPLTERAILFATVKHAGVTRKGNTIPYITHVMEAMEIVSRITDDDEVRAAAVLHDVVEDAGVTLKEISALFGARIAHLVGAESENKREDQAAEDTWRLRKQETIDHLAKAERDVKMIALGDKLSNARAMYRDKRVIGDKLWERFIQKDPAEQKWYYDSLAKIFRKDPVIGKTEAYKEYRKLVTLLFK